MIEHRFGEPLVSHDGITNIGRLVVADPVENMAISPCTPGQRKRTGPAGDSTTLTIVMTHLVYNYFKKMAKDKPRAVQKSRLSKIRRLSSRLSKTPRSKLQMSYSIALHTRHQVMKLSAT